MVTDLERRLTYWNKSAERLYGWTADEAIGRVGRPICSIRTATPEKSQQAYEDVAAARRVDRRAAAAHQGRPPRHHRKPLDAGARRRRQGAQHPLDQHRRHRAARSSSSSSTAPSGWRASARWPAASRTTSTTCWRRSCSASSMLQDRHHRSETAARCSTTVGASARRGAEMVAQVLSFARGMEGQARRDRRATTWSPTSCASPATRCPKNIDIVTDGRSRAAADRTATPRSSTRCCSTSASTRAMRCRDGGTAHARGRARRSASARSHRRAGGRLRDAAGRRHRHRHSAGPARQDLRSVLHHQGSRARAPASASPPR